MKSALSALSFVCFAATALHASVTFTISGTVSAAGLGNQLGYVTGEAVTFVFETDNGFGPYTSSYFTGSSNNWRDEIITNDNLWASITGTGLSGSFTRPISDYNDPVSTIEVEPDVGTGVDSLVRLIASSDQSNFIGFTGPSGTQIRTIQVVAMGTYGFGFPGTYTSLEDYFSPYEGNWSTSSLSSITLNDGSNYAIITVSSISIATTPVPEPSTYASLAGLAALIGAAGRRRHRHR